MVRAGAVLELVCARYGVTPAELRSSREPQVGIARALVYLLLRRHTRLGWRAIARYSTGRDQRTVREQYQRLLRTLAEGSDPICSVVVALDKALVRMALFAHERAVQRVARQRAQP